MSFKGQIHVVSFKLKWTQVKQSVLHIPIFNEEYKLKHLNWISASCACHLNNKFVLVWSGTLLTENCN